MLVGKGARVVINSDQKYLKTHSQICKMGLQYSAYRLPVRSYMARAWYIVTLTNHLLVLLVLLLLLCSSTLPGPQGHLDFSAWAG